MKKLLILSGIFFCLQQSQAQTVPNQSSTTFTYKQVQTLVKKTADSVRKELTAAIAAERAVTKKMISDTSFKIGTYYNNKIATIEATIKNLQDEFFTRLTAQRDSLQLDYINKIGSVSKGINDSISKMSRGLDPTYFKDVNGLYYTPIFPAIKNALTTQ
jgi:hypothetical protein